MSGKDYRVCSNCVMDTSDSRIVFDEKGVCDHCRNFYENIKPNWDTGDAGQSKLNELLARIKRDGAGKKYDCLIGLSGGMDSSYVAYMAVREWGLRPLLFSVDTGWVLPVAQKNIDNIIDKLGVDVCRVLIDQREMMDLQLAYFKSQVPYQDIPQDHTLFAALYNYAAKNGFKYVLTGGNFSTECVREPNEWVHCNDLRQLKDIQRRFGTMKLKNLETCSMFKYRLWYRYVKGVKVCKVLDYIPYSKKDAAAVLAREFGWQPYKNKHYEDLFTRFYEGYWLIKKFGYDKRRAHFSSLILTGQMTRDEALSIIESDPYPDSDWREDMQVVCDKLGITIAEFEQLMAGENKTWRDYKSSKPMIDLAMKAAQLVGMEKRNFR